MTADPTGDRIVRTETNLRAPTGEGTTYVGASGARWRSDPYSGGVTCGVSTGTLVGGGKFGPTHVKW